MGVGRAVRVKGCSGAMAVTRVFWVRVARSFCHHVEDGEEHAARKDSLALRRDIELY